MHIVDLKECMQTGKTNQCLNMF